MTKRILTILLAVAMVACAFPVTVFATESTTPSLASSETTADLVIDSVADLQSFANQVNGGDNFAGKTVKLGANIVFGEDDYWYNNQTGVDYVIKNFAGTFDGNGHTITGMKYNFYISTTSTGDFSGPAMGLFGTVEAEGVVKNLTLDTVTAVITIDGTARLRAGFGFLACSLKGTAENCHVKNVTVNTNGRIRESGAMFTGVSGTAIGCTATNVSITTTSSQAAWTFEDMGGFAGVVTGTLENCHIDTVVISGNPDRSNYKKVGGFIGRTNNDSVVTVCSAKNVTIYANNQFDHVAGFVGHAENTGNATFTDCLAENITLTVDKTSSAKVGGFAGEAKGCTITGCTVAGVKINVGAEGGSSSIGSTSGFVGQTNGDGATFTNCSVTGLEMTLKGDLENGVGGFITSTGGAGGTFNGCSVEGTIDASATGADDAVGGFLGNLGWGGAATNTITGSSAAVNITANGPVGGFVGKAESSNANATLTVEDCSASGELSSESGEVRDFAGTGETGAPADGEYEFTGEVVGADLVISTVDQLKAFAAAVNAGDNFAGKLVKLGADIEVNDYWFNNETNVDFRITKDFAGTFDGNGHTISGLKFKNTDINKNPNMYIFSSISGTVKNLTLDGVDADINDRDCFGFIAYKLTGTAENCHVKNVTVDVAVNASGTGYMYSSGAMFGQIAGAQVDGCTAEHVTFRPTGTDNMDNIGALIGTASGDGEERSTVKNCSVKDVNYDCTRKTKRTGGFIGGASNTDFTDCTVTDLTINVDTYYQSIGGFIGDASTNSTYTRCKVENFKLTGNSTDYAGDVGGFAAKTGSSTDIPVKFTDCSVTGLDMDLTCNDNNEWTAGGFLGYATSNVDIDNCTVAGTIDVTGTGTDHELGSFVGTLDWTSDKDITIDGSTSTVPGDFIGENSFGNDLTIDGVEIVPTNWIELADTSWYVEGQTEFTITTPEQLAGLAKLVNDGDSIFEDVIIRLGADIDLAGLEWTPIGSYYTKDASGNHLTFSGCFEGQGHTISNLYINQPEKSNQGLFGYAAIREIKDLTLNNVEVYGKSYSSALLGENTYAAGKISNIKVTGKAILELANYEGGLILGTGPMDTIENIEINASEDSYVKAKNEKNGGDCIGSVFGGYQNVQNAKNITSNVDVYGRVSCVGGIGGCSAKYSENLTYTGNVYVTEKSTGNYGHYHTEWKTNGRIYGKTNDATVTNAKATGTLTVGGEVITSIFAEGDEDLGMGFRLNDTRFGGFNTITIIDPVTNWIELADTSWYKDENKTVTAWDAGSHGIFNLDTYTITTPEQLAGLAKLVNEGNTFSAVRIQLGADLDLTALEWTPIGLTSSTPFRGHFDGQNHTITGLNIDTAYTYAGLFGYVRNQTTNWLTSFENVTFNNVTIKNGTNSGALFGDAYYASYNNWNGGVIQINNIKLTGDVVIEGTNAGGLVGSGWMEAGVGGSNITVDVNEDSYIYGTECAGGVFASAPHCRGISNVTSNITVKGEGVVGGIAGKAGWTWDNLTCIGTVIATGENVNAGKIFGQISDNTWWQEYTDLVGMTELNGEVATLTINEEASEQLFPAKGGFGGEFAYVDGKVHQKTALVSIDGGEGVLMTWPEAMEAIAGKTAVITLTLANGATWTYEYGIKVPANTTLTIDLNGKTLEGTIFSEGNLTIKNGSILSYTFVSAIESYGENAVLTIEDGVTVKSYRHAIRAEGGKVVINGGVFQAWGRTGEAETVHAINAGGAFATEVIINGGEFRGIKYDNKAETADSGAAVNAQDNATVTINGGKFGYGQNETLRESGTGNIIVMGGTFDQDPTAFVAEGYKVKSAETEGWFEVVEDDAVAKIGDVKYETIEAAFAAAKAGETITLLKDCALTKSIKINRAITLKLNGHTLTADKVGVYMFMVMADFTVNGEGTIKATGIDEMFNVGNVTLTINDNVTLISEYNVIRPGGTANVQINGGTLTSEKGAVLDPYADYSATTITKGENVDIDAPAGYFWKNNVLTAAAASVTAPDGTVTYYEDVTAALKEATGGNTAGNHTVTLLNDCTSGIITGFGAVQNVVLDLNGKTLTVAAPFYVANNDTLTIKDSSGAQTGKVMCTSWGGINVTAPNGTLIVESVTITHDSNFNSGYAPISQAGSGKVIINGGKIIADENHYAIGSGSAGVKGGEITVNGGEIQGKIYLDSASGVDNVKFNGGTFAITLEIEEGYEGTITKKADLQILAPEDYVWENDTLLTEIAYAAEVNGTKYEDLNEAIRQAFHIYGDVTVNILADGAMNGYSHIYDAVDFYDPFDMSNITLNLNGHTVTVDGEVMLMYGDSLTITGNGEMVFTGSGALRAMQTSNGTTGTKSAIVIENGTFINNTDGTVIIVDASATLTVNGGTFTSSGATPVIGVAGSATVTLNAGTYPETALKVTGRPAVTKEANLAVNAPEDYEWENDTTLVKANYAAQIGDTKYKTFTEAQSAAKDGDTITLLADVSITSNWKINANKGALTLDLNGKTFAVGTNQIMVYNDLTVTGSGKVTGSADMIFQVVGKLTINGDAEYDNPYGVFYPNPGATVVLNGGTYPEGGVSRYDALDIKNIDVTKAESVTIKTPNGYGWVNNKLALTAVAQILGRTELYDNLQDAIKAVMMSGQTIVLLDDIVLTEGVVIPAEKKLTIDLNGKTISYESSETTGNAAITNYGVLTITGNGKITYESTAPSSENAYATNAITNYGTLTVVNGTIENTTTGGASYAIDNNSTRADATVTVNGGKITSAKTAIRQFVNSATNKNIVNINGGEISGYYAAQIHLASGDTKVAPNAALNITGGTLTSTDETYNLAVYSWSNGNAQNNVNVTISGGTFNGDVAMGSGAGDSTTVEKLTITGGTFKEVYTYDTADDINISGGTYKAPVAEAYCAPGFVPKDNGNGTYGVERDPSIPESAQIVTIGSAADFDAFAAAVNGQTTYQGVNVSWNKNLYVLITADIDMSKVTFTTAIGSYGNGGGFSGTLDGQGHKLYNYTVSGNWNYGRALFRQASDITVKDITFDKFNSNAAGATDIKTRPAGIIFASVLGEKNVFENVTLTDSVLYGDNGLGTLMGYGSGAYDNSYVTEYSFINCKVENCTIYSETDRAGILGEFGRDGDVILTIKNCTFNNNKLVATIDGETTTTDLPVWYNHGAAAIEKDGKIYTYEYIDDAINAAIKNGGTVVLAKDIALTKEQTVAAAEDAVKFNLNGHTLTVAEGYTLKNNDDGTYTVMLNEYKIQYLSQIKLVEPWGLRMNYRLTNHGKVVDLANLNKGVYFFRDSDIEGYTLDSLTPATLAELGISETAMTLVNGLWSGTFDSGIYTYELNQNIHVMFWCETEQGISFRVDTVNLYELAEKRKDSTNETYSESEKAVYAKMVALCDAATTHRNNFENPEKPKIESGAAIGDIFQGATIEKFSSDVGVKYSPQVSLVEPWGMKLNGFLPESVVNDIVEYGAVVLYDVNNTYNGVDLTVEQLITDSNARLYSNLEAQTTSANGVRGYMITAVYNDGIYTYQMDSDIYVTFYVKNSAGEYQFTDVKGYNLLDRIQKLASNSKSETEKGVANAMIEMNSAIIEYREEKLTK